MQLNLDVSVHEFYRLKALSTLEQVKTTEWSKKKKKESYRIYSNRRPPSNKRPPQPLPPPTQTQIITRRDFPEDGVFYRLFYRKLALLYLCVLLQNKHTTLAENGENLISA